MLHFGAIFAFPFPALPYLLVSTIASHAAESPPKTISAFSRNY